MNDLNWDEILVPEFIAIAGSMDSHTRNYMAEIMPGFVANALSCSSQPVSADEKAVWDMLTGYRCINDFAALPLGIQQELMLIGSYVREHDPQATVKLTGSWPRGNWADEHSSAVFRAMRYRIRKKLDVSDLDVLIDSAYPFTRPELQVLVTTKVDLWKVNYNRVTGIVF